MSRGAGARVEGAGARCLPRRRRPSKKPCRTRASLVAVAPRPAGARPAPARPDRPGARRPRPVLRVPGLRRLGRRAGRLAGRRRPCAGCSAPAHYLVPVALVAARRDRRAAPGAARRAPVPLGRDLPVPGRDARRCRPGRSASGRTACARTGGTRSGSRRAAAWSGRRSTGASTTLFGAVGAHILAIFLFLAGVLLLTGASVAGVIKSTSDSVSSTTRELRDGRREGAAPAAPSARAATTWRRSSAPPA